jgi:oligopeptidase B
MLERPASPAEPCAKRVPHTSTWHGITLVDDYAWLKAHNWQDVVRDPAKLDPAIRAYLEDENRYADHMLIDTAALQTALFEEMKGRIKQDDSTVPSVDGPFAYYVRYRQGGQHPVYCREPRAGGAEEILLDGDKLAAGKTFFRLASTEHSPDHRLLAWAVDDNGSELYTIRIRNLATAADLTDTVTDSAGSIVWTADQSAFYYIRLDDNHRPSRVFMHRIGKPADQDILIHEEPDPQYFVSISKTRSGRYAEISVHDHETSESRLIDLTSNNPLPMLVTARATGIQYDVEYHPNLFGHEGLVFRTNADGAEDFKIMWTPLATPDRSHLPAFTCWECRC